MAASPVTYRWTAGAAMLRASTYPYGLDLPSPPDLSARDATTQARAWLACVWQHSSVRDAVEIASPGLAERINAALDGAPSPRSVRRLVLSLSAYLLRWQRRSTPFGAFAGVTGARIADHAAVVWPGNHEQVTRADSGWLASVITLLEQQPRLLERLTVQANNTATVRGNRIVLPTPPHDRARQQAPESEASLQHSAPISAALEQAQQPIRYPDLRARLAEQFPRAATEVLDGMLTGLVRQQFLLSALQPPMTVHDGLAHIRRVLAGARAGELPEVADAVAELSRCHEALTGGAPVPDRSECLRAVHDTGDCPVVVDTRLDAAVTLPLPVIAEAEAATAALMRLSGYPFGYPH